MRFEAVTGEEMDRLFSILKKYYALEPMQIYPATGGWSALAYKVHCDNYNCFLKAYEKKNVSTAYWTAHLDDYMPVLVWLSRESPLSKKVPSPVLTTDGGFWCQDEEHIFVLFDYIEGETVGETPLSHHQVLELAQIMAELHTVGATLPFSIQALEDDFSLPFLVKLEAFLNRDLADSPSHVKNIAKPYKAQLLEKVEELCGYQNILKRSGTLKTLCHTDAHGWNLMQSRSLILIDWEGMRLAPAEADLFMFAGKENWDVFWERYSQLRPGYILNPLALRFYTLRRKMEDIWAFMERLLYDGISGEQRQKALVYLRSGCKHLNDDCFDDGSV
jgi:thiamine kinase-like enzyme